MLRPPKLPTTPAPRPTPMRTKARGVTWWPNKTTTKGANVQLKHARDFNALTRNLSILNVMNPIGDDDEDC